MKKAMILLGLVLALAALSGFTVQTQEGGFISEWVTLEPGKSVVIEHGLGYRPFDLHVWAPLHIGEAGGDFDAAMPAENLGCAVVESVDNKGIQIASQCEHTTWVQVYAR